MLQESEFKGDLKKAKVVSNSTKANDTLLKVLITTLQPIFCTFSIYFKTNENAFVVLITNV